MCMQKADQVGRGGGYHLLGDQKKLERGWVFGGETILSDLAEMVDQVCVCVFCGWTDQKSRSISDPHQTLKIKPWLVSEPAHKSICSDVKICQESTITFIWGDAEIEYSGTERCSPWRQSMIV